MGLKIGQNINFRPFFNFGLRLLGCDTVFWTAACFSFPTCRGHNFFVLTGIWVCEVSWERFLNVECNHEGI